MAALPYPSAAVMRRPTGHVEMQSCPIFPNGGDKSGHGIGCKLKGGLRESWIDTFDNLSPW